jgi:hypothetical protein
MRLAGFEPATRGLELPPLGTGDISSATSVSPAYAQLDQLHLDHGVRLTETELHFRLVG